MNNFTFPYDFIRKNFNFSIDYTEQAPLEKREYQMISILKHIIDNDLHVWDTLSSTLNFKCDIDDLDKDDLANIIESRVKNIDSSLTIATNKLSTTQINTINKYYELKIKDKKSSISLKGFSLITNEENEKEIFVFGFNGKNNYFVSETNLVSFVKENINAIAKRSSKSKIDVVNWSLTYPDKERTSTQEEEVEFNVANESWTLSKAQNLKYDNIDFLHLEDHTIETIDLIGNLKPISKLNNIDTLNYFTDAEFEDTQQDFEEFITTSSEIKYIKFSKINIVRTIINLNNHPVYFDETLDNDEILLKYDINLIAENISTNTKLNIFHLLPFNELPLSKKVWSLINDELQTTKNSADYYRMLHLLFTKKLLVNFDEIEINKDFLFRYSSLLMSDKNFLISIYNIYKNDEIDEKNEQTWFDILSFIQSNSKNTLSKKHQKFIDIFSDEIDQLSKNIDLSRGWIISNREKLNNLSNQIPEIKNKHYKDDDVARNILSDIQTTCKQLSKRINNMVAHSKDFESKKITRDMLVQKQKDLLDLKNAISQTIEKITYYKKIND